MRSLTEAFLDYFDVRLANTALMREQVASIRYRVYCEEFGFESAAQFPGKKEFDDFDPYSLHCLVTHRRSGLPAGCVRLVCASEDNELPLEKYCLGSIYIQHMDDLRSKPENICEFSRLAVDTIFRRRTGEEHTRLGEFNSLDCSRQELRTFSLIGITTFISALALADLIGRGNIFGMMESNLPKMLRRSGLPVKKVGAYMDYHGQRAPYYLSAAMAQENMREDLRTLYDTIHAELALNFIAREAVA